MEMIWTEKRQRLALDTCRKWHGTKHSPRVAIPGVGIDCIHLLAEILVDSNIIPRTEFAGYSMRHGMFDTTEKIQDALKSCLNLEVLRKGTEQFGDLVVFRTGERSAHCGFYENQYVWHCLGPGAVTRSRYVGVWRARARTIMRIVKCGLKTDPQEIANR